MFRGFLWQFVLFVLQLSDSHYGNFELIYGLFSFLLNYQINIIVMDYFIVFWILSFFFSYWIIGLIKLCLPISLFSECLFLFVCIFTYSNRIGSFRIVSLHFWFILGQLPSVFLLIFYGNLLFIFNSISKFTLWQF